MRSALISFFLTALCIGCSAETSSTKGDIDVEWNSNASDTATATTPDYCGVEGTALGYPSMDGASDFYYRGSVEFVFDGFDEGATIELTDGAGANVAGNTNWEGSSLLFAPSVPLAASTNYSATLTHCAGSASVSFRTSNLGSALEVDPSDLVGNTYVIELDGARVVQPAGVGSLLLGMFEQDILLGVTNASDTEIEMMGAISRDDSTAQDLCAPSTDFPQAADFTSAPFFSIGPQDTNLYNISISQLNIAGDFTADGSQIDGAILSGEIDARDLVGALVSRGLLEEEDPNALCDLIGTFGVACEACATDGEPYCLSLYIDQITANLDDQTLIAQDECDPEACSDGCDETAGIGGCAHAGGTPSWVWILTLLGLLMGRRRNHRHRTG